RLPLSTPRNGSNNGSTFNTSQEPPGRNGASHSSHNRHSAISASSDTEAPWRSTGLSRGVVILVLLPGLTNEFPAQWHTGRNRHASCNMKTVPTPIAKSRQQAPTD